MSILKSTNTGRSTFEVDLGLSVNWCSCNVGANRPEEAGLYFAWGDTKGYKASEISPGIFNDREWYSKLPASKIKENLKLKYDAANVYMKGNWRIPSIEELTELKEKTKQAVEVLRDIKGIRFIAKNGNSIFIPFAGYGSNYFGDILSSNEVLECWSSTIKDKYFSFNLFCRSDADFACTSELRNARYLGFSIRAVCSR